MKKIFLLSILAIGFWTSLSAQNAEYELKQNGSILKKYDREWEIVFPQPNIVAHSNTGLIYRDTLDNQYVNLSGTHLRIANGPIGLQFLNKDVEFTTVTRNSFGIYHYAHMGFPVINLYERGAWRPRSLGGVSTGHYDFRTFGDIWVQDYFANRQVAMTMDKNGGAIDFYRYDGGDVYVTTLGFDPAGNLGFSAVSDLNAKENISDVGALLPSIMALSLKKYNYKGNDQETTGFIAQEVREIFPDLVTERDGLLRLNYGAFSQYAIKAIQEQQETIETLEDRVAHLETMLTQLMEDKD